MKTQHLSFATPNVIDRFDRTRYVFLRARPGDSTWNYNLNRLYAYPPELQCDGISEGTIAIDHDPGRSRPWMVYSTVAQKPYGGNDTRKRFFKNPRSAFRAFRDEVRDARMLTGRFVRG